MTASQRDESPDAVLWWQAYQLAQADREDELRACAIAGNEHARRELASWLADRRRIDEALAIIRPLAEAGDDVASLWLARWLAERNDADELRGRTASGDYYALLELACWLARREQHDELRELIAESGPKLASWVAGQGDMHIVQLAAEAGDDHARQRLERWLARLRERMAAGQQVAQGIEHDWT